jgi:hypothetical protein
MDNSGHVKFRHRKAVNLMMHNYLRNADLSNQSESVDAQTGLALEPPHHLEDNQAL